MDLTPIRDELSLLPGPTLSDGQPSWTLHDPVRDLFFRIDWPTFEILSRWHLGDPQQIAQAVRSETTLHVEAEAIEDVVDFLAKNELVAVGNRGESSHMAAQLQSLEGTIRQKLLHNYLFFRVPLWRPDSWLERWQPIATMFQTRRFLMLSLCALLASIWLVTNQSQVFYGTFVDKLSFEGLLSYAIAIVVVKFLHELGHAFAAKKYGCRVPTIGVAFLVLWPVPYTDTNAVWRLQDRWQRLRVSCAGIVVELTVAIWATLAWALLPPGALRSAAYFLATTSWIMTLIVNASPFMRFDGYFILCDLLDMPNLHPRSFALARWRLREWLFRLNEPKPEHFAPAKENALILFALAVWLYRLTVFIGIAAIVYHFTIKIVGIILFSIEIYYFIAMPIIRELRTWKEFLPSIKNNPASLYHSRRMLAWAALILALLTFPLPSRIVTSGLLQPVQTWQIIAPEASQVIRSELLDGRQVTAGEPVVQLRVGDLEMQARINEARVKQVGWQAASAGLSKETRDNWQVERQSLVAAQSEREAISASRDRLGLRAPFNGMIRDVESGITVGQWVTAGEQLGVLFAGGRMEVETYLDDSDIKRVRIGDWARFVSDSGEGPIALKVTAIDSDTTRILPDGLLTTFAGGHIAVRDQGQQHLPEQSVYRVQLAAEDVPEALKAHKWRGRVVIGGNWESIAGKYFRQALAVILREAGL